MIKSSIFVCELFILATSCSMVNEVRLTLRRASITSVLPWTRVPSTQIADKGWKWRGAEEVRWRWWP